MAIICARIYYVAFEWDYYSQHLAEIPLIMNGGIAIHGGLIGAFLTGFIICRKRICHSSKWLILSRQASFWHKRLVDGVTL